MNKEEKFNQIARDIKSIKIQGARNIAKSAFYAYKLIPTKESKKKLIALRPTEPMLVNILNNADKLTYDDVITHLDDSQEKINKEVFKLIKNNSVVFTHCHSTNVIHALIYAKKHGKKFEVYNTETRPLFQGRKTAKELSKEGINVTTFVDSAIGIALTKSQETKKVDLVLLGSDAILKKGVVNKVGSGTISQLAKINKIPVHIIADSWKFSPKGAELEERDFHEVWKEAPMKIKVENPAFEFVPKTNIKSIISELGNLSFSEFLKEVKKRKLTLN
jgi:ribose 1,5-bisphosphate isomerase